VVLAKDASLAASEIDRAVVNRAHVAIIKLDDSVAQLRALQNAERAPWHPLHDINTEELADEHAARAATCREIASMLEAPVSAARMSPEELDALAIVKAKVGCKTMMSRTSEGLENMKQKTLASVASVEPAGQDQSTPPASEPMWWERTTLLECLQEKTQAGVQKVRQAANDRVEIARAGKQFLEDGGECAAQVVVAKEALSNAAAFDRELADRVQSAIAAFDASVTKLRAVHLNSWNLISTGQSKQQDEGISGNSDLAELVEEHEARASAYRQISSMLEMPVRSVEMGPAECDALSLVKMRNGCGTIQCRTNEGFEAVKSFAFSGCASEWDRECRAVNRDCRMRTACA